MCQVAAPTCLPALYIVQLLPQINYNLVQFYRLQINLQALTIEPSPVTVVSRRVAVMQLLTRRMSDYYAMVSAHLS